MIGAFGFISVHMAWSQQEQEKDAQMISELEKGVEYIQLLQSQSNSNTLRSADDTGEDDIMLMPPGVDPFVSMNSKDKGSYRLWNAYNHSKVNALAKRKAKRNVFGRTVTIDEQEQPGEFINQFRTTAEALPNFGASRNQNGKVVVNGNLQFTEVPEIRVDSIAFEEDNGSIPLASQVVFDTTFVRKSISGFLGDGPNASADLDFYSVDLNQGDLLEINLQETPASDLSLFLLILNSQGQLIDFVLAPTSPAVFQSSINFIAPVADSYAIAIVDLLTLQANPFNTIDLFVSGGLNPGGNTGAYALDLTYIGQTELDVYSFDLKKGDVFGISVQGRPGTRAELLNSANQFSIGTNEFTIRAIEESPFMLQGQTGFNYIIPQDGNYALALGNNVGPYEATFAVTRPGNEINKGNKQILFIDFAGETVTLQDFFNIPEDQATPPLTQERVLSPLESFLEQWGIENTPINRFRIITKTMRVVRENLRQDFIESGLNPNFDVQIMTDYGFRSFGDNIKKLLDFQRIPFSDVLVAGTTQEFGVQTIGIANAIDVGNYSLDDRAVVLLDVISDTLPTAALSFNNVPLAEGSTIEDVVVEGLGNIIAHEAGHYLGNFHSSNQAGTNFNIMDEGGTILNILGIPNGETFGGPTMVDVDFAKDVYSTNEFFQGLNENDINTAYALSFVPFGYKTDAEVPYEQLAALDQENRQKIEQSLQIDFASSQILGYPNPMQLESVTNLELSGTVKGQTTIQLYDLQGRKVATLFDATTKANDSEIVKFDPSQYKLTAGTYILTITSIQGSISEKIVLH